MIVVYLGWRLVDIYLGTGHNAKPASREIRDSKGAKRLQGRFEGMI